MNMFHVLFIDSYDSFSFNVQRLLERQFNGTVDVVTIRNDTFNSMAELSQFLPLFDCLVIGPGPGNPINGSRDVGILDRLFQWPSVKRIPILGICLGMQVMCLSQGCEIKQLHTIKHGQVYDIHVTEEGKDNLLYADYPKSFKSTRYHSLHVIKSRTSDNEKDTIVPLSCTNDENGELLMGVKVKNCPWYAVQYHPESCCSEQGDLLIQNFIKIAKHWNKVSTDRYDLKSRARIGCIDKLIVLNNAIDKTPLCRKGVANGAEKHGNGTKNEIYIKEYQIEYDTNYDSHMVFKLIDQIKQDKFILASSSLSKNRGEWSVIALPDTNSEVFTHYESLHKTTQYRWQDPNVTHELLRQKLKEKTTNGGSSENIKVQNENKDEFWKNIAQFMDNKLINVRPDLPFIGGLIGILGYEMGYYVTNKENRIQNKPDAKFVYINNTILVNHYGGKMYLISLNDSFPEDINRLIMHGKWYEHSISWKTELPKDVNFDIKMPTEDEYSKAFEQCQDYMHKGDSYEMCLTTQTIVTPSSWLDPATIFKVLLQRNPAPFSSYFKFNDILSRDSDKNTSQLCFISTSPERFIKWDGDTCELRPIKGTVKKGPEMTFERATEILKTPKEFGENLMILDLIRNDLYELLPDVSVEEFMTVEEYKTVYQLVSVVKARGLEKSPFSGFDLLKHSLPPGSMTGAPKKITVELLQDKIESHLNRSTCGADRGIYSGVTGYWSSNGNGDWSVNIRCMSSYDGGHHWSLGAGGAITVLSTLEGEREEMFTKLESALQVFQ